MDLKSWVDAQKPETVAQVASRLGIGRVALHRVMSGATFPSADTCAAIVRETAGAVSLADLVATHHPGAAGVAA